MARPTITGGLNGPPSQDGLGESEVGWTLERDSLGGRKSVNANANVNAYLSARALTSHYMDQTLARHVGLGGLVWVCAMIQAGVAVMLGWGHGAMRDMGCVYGRDGRLEI